MAYNDLTNFIFSLTFIIKNNFDYIMTIHFITVHVGANSGSVLQTLATHQILSQYAENVEVINYIPPRVTTKRFWERHTKSLSALFRSIGFPLIIANRRIYGNGLKRYCNLSTPIYNEDELSYIEGDTYVTGSDQVWNSIWNEGIDSIYYFSKAPKNIKKIAFSSSFGREQLPEAEYSQVKGYLQTYHAISVRESSAQLLVESMGLSATHIQDPTLLIDRNVWFKFISHRVVKEPYIFVYLPYNIVDKERIYDTARKIAKRKGLKIVTSTSGINKEKLADKTIFFGSPFDFLSLMYYADYVITNSFHGTAFSVNLNKQFWVYSPSMFSTRINSILSCTKLENRMIHDILDDNRMDETIDYKSVNTILEKERVRAHSFLRENL